MKRRGFLAGLVGLFAAPALPELAPTTKLIDQGELMRGGWDYVDNTTLALRHAERMCNPPMIADSESWGYDIEMDRVFLRHTRGDRHNLWQTFVRDGETPERAILRLRVSAFNQGFR